MKWEIVSNLEGFCGMLNNASGSLEDNILLKVYLQTWGIFEIMTKPSAKTRTRCPTISTN